MKSNMFSAPLLALAAIAAVPAVSAPIFGVTPSVLGGPAGQYLGDKISGNASALLTLNAGTSTVNGSGWVSFNDISLNDNTVIGTGINNNYQLWTEFTYTTKLVSGVFGAAGSQYDVTQLNFTVYGKQLGGANTYVQAQVSPATVVPSVTLGAGVVQTIGTGVLDASGPDSAAFNGAAGTSFNANAVFTLSAFGKTFFTYPDPFYTNAFNSFTNTSQGYAQVGNLIALTQANGAVDFAGQVPEPSSLALVGLGLLGVGVIARRRKA